MIGIIGAMSIEVDGIKSAMKNITEETISSIVYTRGELFGKSCVVAQCSPGKVNGALCAQTMALKYNLSLIINSGVAGGIGKGVLIGDVVIGTACVQHDVDTTMFGDEKGFVSGINIKEIPCDEEYSHLFYSEAKNIYKGNVFKGIVATGDQFISDGKKCLEIKEQFNAYACEMEGGSIAHVCYINSIPFVVIRSISDNANESGSVDYLTFAKEAADRVIELLHGVIPKIQAQ